METSKICRQGQLQNRSFHFVDRTTTGAGLTTIENARAKRAKVTFFMVNMQICDVPVAVFVVVD